MDKLTKTDNRQLIGKIKPTEYGLFEDIIDSYYLDMNGPVT